MSHGNLTQLDTEGFKARLKSFAPGSDVPDSIFAEIVYTAITQHGLPPSDLREFFGLSAFAVDHWILAKNLPQQIVRAKICLWIADNL
jgi:hypothetical protein